MYYSRKISIIRHQIPISTDISKLFIYVYINLFYIYIISDINYLNKLPLFARIGSIRYFTRMYLDRETVILLPFFRCFLKTPFYLPYLPWKWKRKLVLSAFAMVFAFSRGEILFFFARWYIYTVYLPKEMYKIGN